jgi:hypothetical protein
LINDDKFQQKVVADLAKLIEQNTWNVKLDATYKFQSSAMVDSHVRFAENYFIVSSLSENGYVIEIMKIEKIFIDENYKDIISIVILLRFEKIISHLYRNKSLESKYS